MEKMTATIEDLKPGELYSFRFYAVSQNLRSEGVTVQTRTSKFLCFYFFTFYFFFFTLPRVGFVDRNFRPNNGCICFIRFFDALFWRVKVIYYCAILKSFYSVSNRECFSRESLSDFSRLFIYLFF